MLKDITKKVVQERNDQFLGFIPIFTQNHFFLDDYCYPPVPDDNRNYCSHHNNNTNNNHNANNNGTSVMSKMMCEMGMQGIRDIIDAAYLLKTTAERGIERTVGDNKKLVNSEGMETLKRGVSSLLGLGEGLTPSGDDALVGVSSTLSYFEVGNLETRGLVCLPMINNAISEVILEQLFPPPPSQSPLTTDVATAYLEYGARKRAYAERVVFLLQKIMESEDRQEVSLLVRAAALDGHWGSSSGCDFLLGVLAGLCIAVR